MDKITENKISELQTIEQNLQRFLSQKQNLQSQIIEVETALKELPQSGEAYKIIGNIMVSVNKDKLTEELGSKKELANIKLKSIEKQEEGMRTEADSIQKELMELVKEKKWVNKMDVTEVIETLEEIQEDSTVPKNVRNKLGHMILELKSKEDLSLKVNKSLSELDDICEEINLPTFIRTQLWGVTSMLEKLT